jgi:hypothetical protein
MLHTTPIKLAAMLMAATAMRCGGKSRHTSVRYESFTMFLSACACDRTPRTYRTLRALSAPRSLQALLHSRVREQLDEVTVGVEQNEVHFQHLLSRARLHERVDPAENTAFLPCKRTRTGASRPRRSSCSSAPRTAAPLRLCEQQWDRTAAQYRRRRLSSHCTPARAG